MIPEFYIIAFVIVSFVVITSLLLFQPAFWSHPDYDYCHKRCYIWQDCVRPSDAYHTKCLHREFAEEKGGKE